MRRGQVRDRSRDWAPALALVALVLVGYAPSIGGGFLWDDDANVVDNPTIKSLRGLAYIWTEPRANQQYYPLTHTSFWVEHALWGLRPTAFRITNLLLHAGVAALLWRALRRLAVPGAWVAGALFAVHPVHVETAAWITERKNLLSALLYFAALLAWLRFAAGGPGRRRAWVVAFLLFVAALASKTAVLTLPAALLVLGWWRTGRIGRGDLLPTLPLFAVGAAAGAMTWWLERGHVGAAGPEWDLGPLERLLVASRALWFYAGKLALPLDLSFIYPRWEVDARAAWQYLFPFAAVALVALLWRGRERIGRGGLAAALFFGITLAPALGLLDFYFQLYAYVQDHFQYLASAGPLALAAAWGTVGLRRLHPRAGVLAAAAAILLLGGATWSRSRQFTSEEALWTGVLERNPRAWMAEINLGLLREEQGRLDEAERCFRRALETPHAALDKAHYNLARVLEARGRLGEAEAQYRRALAVDPRHADAHNNLGNLLAAQGSTDRAVAHYRMAVEAEPLHVTARYNLALRLDEQGAVFEAEQQLREVLRVNPGHADAADALGRIVAALGRHAEAAELFRRVLALDAERPVVHYNLALSLEGLGRPDLAERHYRAAIALDPALAGAHNNLAIVLFHAGRHAEAWQQVRRYQALGGVPHPDFLAALAAVHAPPDP